MKYRHNKTKASTITAKEQKQQYSEKKSINTQQKKIV